MKRRSQCNNEHAGGVLRCLRRTSEEQGPEQPQIHQEPSRWSSPIPNHGLQGDLEKQVLSLGAGLGAGAQGKCPASGPWREDPAGPELRPKVQLGDEHQELGSCDTFFQAAVRMESRGQVSSAPRRVSHCVFLQRLEGEGKTLGNLSKPLGPEARDGTSLSQW